MSRRSLLIGGAAATGLGASQALAFFDEAAAAPPLSTQDLYAIFMGPGSAPTMQSR